MINERMAELLDGDRAVTVRTRRGRPLVSIGLVPALAAGVAAFFFAPRITAVAAVGAMFRGVRLTLDHVDSEPEAEAA